MASTPPRRPQQTTRFNNVRHARMDRIPTDPNLMKTEVLGMYDPYGTGHSVVRSGPSQPWNTYRNGMRVAPKTPNRPIQLRVPTRPQKVSKRTRKTRRLRNRRRA